MVHLPGLAYETVGTGERVVLFVHGILGQGRNWRTFARMCVARSPGWRAVLVDLRNHGASPPLPPPHDLAACAADLARLGEEVGPPSVAVGHSFGGKVVLTWAVGFAPTAELWVLDSPPSGGRPATTGDPSDPRTVLAALRAAPVPAVDREVLRTFLRGRHLSETVVAWLLTSTRKDPDGWRFVYDLDGVEAMLESYFAADMWPLLAEVEAPVHLVRGLRSGVWPAADLARLAALPAGGPADVQVVDAGHWLHVEAAEELLDLLRLPA